MSMLDFIRELNAAKKFIIKDQFSFIEFDDVSKEHIQKTQTIPETLEIWAAVKIHYEGEMPESYKVLNLLIGDWVEKHTRELTPVIYKELKSHFKKHYDEKSDISDLEKTEESPIWQDQLDYMPRAESKDDSMIIEIELVLNAEPLGE
jgi:hypothetical protein